MTTQWCVFCNDNNFMVDGKKVKRVFECKDNKEAHLIHFNLSLVRKKLKLSHAYITDKFPAAYKTGKFAVFIHTRETNPDMYEPQIPYLELDKGALYIPK